MGLIHELTPSDTDVVGGAKTLLCLADGNVVLKGTQTGAANITAFPMVAGEQIEVPSTFYLAVTGTTATVAVLGP